MQINMALIETGLKKLSDVEALEIKKIFTLLDEYAGQVKKLQDVIEGYKLVENKRMDTAAYDRGTRL